MKLGIASPPPPTPPPMHNKRKDSLHGFMGRNFESRIPIQESHVQGSFMSCVLKSHTVVQEGQTYLRREGKGHEDEEFGM